MRIPVLLISFLLILSTVPAVADWNMSEFMVSSDAIVTLQTD